MSNLTHKIRIIVVEPVQSTRTRIRRILESIPEIAHITICGTAAESLSELQKMPYEILITALELPQMSGLELMEIAHASFPDLKCIACTNNENIPVIQSVFRAGGSGYLVKSCEPQSVRNSLIRLMEGYYVASPRITHLLISGLIENDNASLQQLLTRRELDILDALIDGYHYKEIAYSRNLSVHTIHTHIKHIYRKLNANGRKEAIAIAKELGHTVAHPVGQP